MSIVGYGRDTVGGAGGERRVVTTTADSGAGSLREALETPGVAVVVFDASLSKQYITLTSGAINVTGYKSVLGPAWIRGDGFRLDNNLVASADETIFRDLYVVPGEAGGGYGWHYLYDVQNSVIDHCYLAHWGGVSTNGKAIGGFYGAVQNLTVSNSVFYHPLDLGWSMNLTGGMRNVTFYRNVISSGRVRNPVIGSLLSDTGNTLARFDLVNNVFFNWISHCVNVNNDATRINIISNYFKYGPMTSTPGARQQCVLLSISDDGSDPVGVVDGAVWIEDTYYEYIDATTEWDYVTRLLFNPKQAVSAPVSKQAAGRFSLPYSLNIDAGADVLSSVRTTVGPRVRHPVLDQITDDIEAYSG